MKQIHGVTEVQVYSSVSASAITETLCTALRLLPSLLIWEAHIKLQHSPLLKTQCLPCRTARQGQPCRVQGVQSRQRAQPYTATAQDRSGGGRSLPLPGLRGGRIPLAPPHGCRCSPSGIGARVRDVACAAGGVAHGSASWLEAARGAFIA